MREGLRRDVGEGRVWGGREELQVGKEMGTGWRKGEEEG